MAVIGDIHGRLDLLKRLARHPARRMPIFVVGDVVDHGTESKAIVEFLVGRGARGVRGNH